MFKDYIYKKYLTYKLNRLIKKGFIAKDFEPIKCFHCGHDRLHWKDIDSVENITLEKEVTCQKCKKVVGYWVTGNWDVTIHM